MTDRTQLDGDAETHLAPANPGVEDESTHAPTIGGGLPIMQYWAQKTLSPQGPQIWKTLLHKSACLSCAWGTGGQNGGFTNELEEPLQRCMKSVQAISSELQPGLGDHFFARHTISELQQLRDVPLNKVPGVLIAVGCITLRRGSANAQQCTTGKVSNWYLIFLRVPYLPRSRSPRSPQLSGDSPGRV
jgi:hypothetical protein